MILHTNKVIKLIRPLNCVHIYKNQNIETAIYHPSIIIDTTKKNVVNYINMENKNIQEINNEINKIPNKYLPLIINIKNDDIILLNNNMMCYQFRNQYLFSTINCDLNNMVYHMMSNIKNNYNEVKNNNLNLSFV